MNNKTGKTLLIISGGAEAVPGIRRAKAMGLHVVVSDYAADAPGFEYADDKLLASTYDIEETITAARNYHENTRAIDGVICMAADVPLTVASVAEALGLPGLSVASARLAADKIAMKDNFAAEGIAIPWYQAVESGEHLKEIYKARGGRGLVSKPVDSRGARGVLHLDDDTDLDWAFKHALAQSPSGRVMVESYQSGPQISTETIMVNGKGYLAGFIDRNYEYLERFAPYMIENGGEQPSLLSAVDRQAVADLAEQAALAMGITNGIAKGDMVLTPEGPKVIEIAARLSGGWMSSDQIPLATGIDIVGAAIQLALGESPDTSELQAKWQKGVAIRYFFPAAGRVKAVHKVEHFKAKPWVHRLGLFIEPGEEVGGVSDHTKRAGFVITVGKDRQEALQRAREVVDGIVYEME